VANHTFLLSDKKFKRLLELCAVERVPSLQYLPINKTISSTVPYVDTLNPSRYRYTSPIYRFDMLDVKLK
jgi:hypothetical protein